MSTYEITIERIQTTIVQVKANTQKEAEYLAWVAWDKEKEDYGIGATYIVDIKELTQ